MCDAALFKNLLRHRDVGGIIEQDGRLKLLLARNGGAQCAEGAQLVRQPKKTDYILFDEP